MLSTLARDFSPQQNHITPYANSTGVFCILCVASTRDRSTPSPSTSSNLVCESISGTVLYPWSSRGLLASETPGLLSRKFSEFDRWSDAAAFIFFRFIRQNQKAAPATMTTPSPTPTPMPADALVDSRELPDEPVSVPLEVGVMEDDDVVVVVETSELWYMSCSNGA